MTRYPFPIVALILALFSGFGTVAPNGAVRAADSPAPSRVVPPAEPKQSPPGSTAAQEAFASGMAKTRLREYNGAIADFDRVIEINPRYRQVYLNRGSAKMAQGNVEGAIADYERAIAIAPRDPANYLARAMAKRRKGDLDGAIADFDRAIEINPQFTAAINARAAAKRTKGNERPVSKLHPFPGRDLASLRSIVLAESAPPSRDLAQAWEYHGKFKGSWMQNAVKPTPEAVAAFDVFKQELENRKLPAWFSTSSTQRERTFRLALASVENDATFLEQKESEETQQVAALGIVYLTEHELNRHGAANKGAAIISALLVKTPWDWKLHSLYARFLVDARAGALAWQEACLGLYLNPRPEKADLGFVAFVGLVCARNQWEEIKQMFRDAATTASDAEEVIADWGPKFGPGSGLKAGNIPVP